MVSHAITRGSEGVGNCACLNVRIRVRSQPKVDLGLDFGCVVEMKCQSAKIMQFHDGGVCQLRSPIGRVVTDSRRDMAAKRLATMRYRSCEGVS